MRRPHVYERSAPRRRRREASPDPGEAAHRVAQALPALIAVAGAAGLSALAGLLGDARAEAERVGTGR